MRHIFGASMGRIIGIDYGTKRIGLAIGETITRIAMPWKILPGRGDPEMDAGNVRKFLIVEGEKAELFVVGLPKNMDETEGPQAELSRKFGESLAMMTGVAVVYQDERLSSFTAEKKFAPTMRERIRDHRGRESRGGSKKKKKAIDAVAAAVILESYLQSVGR
jgi:putative Holliday junction resolvase